MMNSRWQANKIGLINFWYYDEQEFPFVKGRMLLRGSNGSGKSVTMQSVVPLLLDGNMSPERLDPFGSRDRKMSSYLLEEDDGREERTGYLYLELKRQNSDTYLTIGMGIRARRGKNLDKWYFSLTDGRRIGKDFFLYKDSGEKVTLSKKELENRIGDGGRVIDRQVDYMEYVNRQIFGFETTEEYKEMIDLLIQLRTPKLSKDFKPSVINDILSFCYCALETTAGLWASSYLTLTKGVAPDTAASFASLFYIGITAGRAACGFLTLKFNDTQMIRMGQCILAAGVLALLLPGPQVLALCGLVLVGLGCAPIYPSIIHSTPEHFGADRSQAVIGIQMASAYVGNLAMPPLFGLMANNITPALFPFYLLALLVFMVFMHEQLVRKTSRC